jgi:hypothetical protein
MSATEIVMTVHYLQQALYYSDAALHHALKFWLLVVNQSHCLTRPSKLNMFISPLTSVQYASVRQVLEDIVPLPSILAVTF